MANTRLSAFFSLLLVFASGVIVGVFGYRVYRTSVDPPPRQAQTRPDPEEFRRHLIDETRQAVQLDDAQVVKLGQIYDRTRDKFNENRQKADVENRAIWNEQTTEIEAMLRPEQLPLFKSLREKRDRDRKNRHKGTGDGIRKDR